MKFIFFILVVLSLSSCSIVSNRYVSKSYHYTRYFTIVNDTTLLIEYKSSSSAYEQRIEERFRKLSGDQYLVYQRLKNDTLESIQDTIMITPRYLIDNYMHVRYTAFKGIFGADIPYYDVQF